MGITDGPFTEAAYTVVKKSIKERRAHGHVDMIVYPREFLNSVSWTISPLLLRTNCLMEICQDIGQIRSYINAESW